MKKVLILFEKNDEKDGLSGSLRKQFEDLYVYFYERGIELCRAPIEYFDDESNCFCRVQFFEYGEWIWKENICPEIVYDKTPYYLGKDLMRIRVQIFEQFPFFNDLKLSELLSNKWLTYGKFSKFCPKTVLIENESELEKIGELNSEKVILKPLSGSGGKGIEIFEKEKVEPIEYPFLVQELVNADAGIEDLVDGPHDLRLMICNKKQIYSFLRTPPRNELIANLSRGGTVSVVDLNLLPGSVNELFDFVEEQLLDYPQKFYSVDMIFDKNERPWILEMNSRPGITLETEERGRGEVVWDALIKFFKEL